MARGAFLAAALLAAALVSCSRPLSQEKFVTTDKAQGGVYEFELDLSDSLVLRDLSIFARCARPDTLSVPLLVLWQSPSGVEFEETVYMKPLVDGFSREMYRRAFSIREHGIWHLYIRPLAVPRSFLGIGIICESNGTRQTP